MPHAFRVILDMSSVLACVRKCCQSSISLRSKPTQQLNLHCQVSDTEFWCFLGESPGYTGALMCVFCHALCRGWRGVREQCEHGWTYCKQLESTHTDVTVSHAHEMYSCSNHAHPWLVNTSSLGHRSWLIRLLERKTLELSICYIPEQPSPFTFSLLSSRHITALGQMAWGPKGLWHHLWQGQKGFASSLNWGWVQAACNSSTSNCISSRTCSSGKYCQLHVAK